MGRVVVSGAGSVNALGVGVGRFLDGLRSGVCAIGEMTLFPVEGYRARRAAVAPEVGTPGGVPSHLARRLSRSDRMALVAAEEAWAASEPAPDPDRLGVFLGGTTAGMFEAEEEWRRGSREEARRLRPGRLVSMPVHSTADVLAAVFGAEGPRATFSTACSSGINAIGLAAEAIRDGRADVVLAGGTEGHCRMTYAGFNALQAIDPDVCRPFDRRRAGLSLGEGAAILVLESEERARRRGAAILAVVEGHGMSADAWHMTAPDPKGEGAVLAMRRALEAAATAPEGVDYVNAHGTGTPQNDPAETRAIRAVFGAHAGRLAVSSTKSQIGHCLGAAGAVEALATVLALVHGFIPATVNLEEPDPECDLDFVPREPRAKRVRVALTNSYGFGGNNASLVLRADAA